MIPLKEIRLNNRKDSFKLTSNSRFKYSMDKKVPYDFDKIEKKIKEINISSMTIKDSNFTLERNYSQNGKRKSINKYDYVM